MRGVFPGVRLVTDAPWDAPLAERASTRDLDIRPFAGMHHGQSADRDPTVRGGRHDEPEVWDVAAADLSFDEIVDVYREKYPADILTIDRSEQSIHADSS